MCMFMREHAVSVVVRVRVCACQMQTPFKPTVSQPWPSVSSGAASCMAQVRSPGCVLGNQYPALAYSTFPVLYMLCCMHLSV
jgi:hypothetical protein